LAILPLFYYLIIANSVWKNHKHQIILRLCYLVFLAIIIFSFFSEIIFFDEFQARFNFIAIDYLIYTQEVIGNIFDLQNWYGFYPVYAYALNGTSAFTAATAGTDYVAPGTATTFTATQTFAGSSSVEAMKTSNIAEVDTISATAATGTINYDITTQSVLYYTSNASANWTVNFRGSSGTSLNTLMATGECISATFLVTNGSTAYYNSAVTIDGSSVTPKWQGGTAPTSGNASSVDSYTYVIQKTGSATYVVLAAQTKFA
jgi:hypothetical protein